MDKTRVGRIAVQLMDDSRERYPEAYACDGCSPV